MIVFYYDKTLDGLFSALFEAYDLKLFPDTLLEIGEITPLFTEKQITVVTDQKKANRVWNKLRQKMPKAELNMLHSVWLSEEKESDYLVFQYIKKAIDSKFSNRVNFGDEVVLQVQQLAKKVYKDAERLKQFVRFQKSKDGVYFAPVYPDFNSLPIALPYFQDRFASQPWILYDIKRQYGYYYDLTKVEEIILEGEGSHLIEGDLDKELQDKDEALFQKLWKNYFKAMAIKERINLRQQKQYMPKRYWKYLTEMK